MKVGPSLIKSSEHLLAFLYFTSALNSALSISTLRWSGESAGHATRPRGEYTATVLVIRGGPRVFDGGGYISRGPSIFGHRALIFQQKGPFWCFMVRGPSFLADFFEGPEISTSHGGGTCPSRVCHRM